MKYLYVVLLTYLIEVRSIDVSGEIILKIQNPSFISEESSKHWEKSITKEDTKELSEDRKKLHEPVSEENYDDTEIAKQSSNKQIRAVIKQTEEDTENPKQMTKEDPTKALRVGPGDDLVDNSTKKPIEAPTAIKNRMKASAEHVTAASVLECTYQYPEKDQVQAMLSYIMNQLTKMFVRANDIIKEEDIYEDTVRSQSDTRFRVVSEKKHDFFESIYKNMSRQYLSFYNTTTLRVDRTAARKDPCAHQHVIKGLWKDLLEGSSTTFRQAAFRCVDDSLRARGRGAEDSQVRARLYDHVLQQLKQNKTNQLTMLCEMFQLCYHDLLSTT